ncbi:MAG: HlyD family secretion protein [Aquabacterium sp.]
MSTDRPEVYETPSSSFGHAYREGYHDGFRDGLRDSARAALRSGHAWPEARSAAEPHRDDAKDADGSDKAGKNQHDQGEQQKNDKTPLYKRPLFVGLVLLVLLMLILAGIWFWRHNRAHETTDDAFVDGNTTAMAAEAGGRIVKLYVQDNQVVHAGDPLLDIDSRDDSARRDQARAQVTNAQGQLELAMRQVEVRRATALQANASVHQAQAELTKADQDADRFNHVDPQAVATQQRDAAIAAQRNASANAEAASASQRSAVSQVDAAQAQVRAAEAQVHAAQATLAAADLQVAHHHVVAPVDGRIARRSVEVGNVVAPGQALLSLIGTQLWVTANYKETQLTHIRPGQRARIRVDAYPDVEFNAHVDSIQRGTGAYFSLLPAENATGNYVKVVQRVPVKIVFDDDRLRDHAIGPGMSVTPDIDVDAR